jgi:hypothetical protein
MNDDILEVDALGVDFIQIDEFTCPYFSRTGPLRHSTPLSRA